MRSRRSGALRALALGAAAVLLPCCTTPGNQPTLGAVTVRVSVQANGDQGDAGTNFTPPTGPGLGSTDPGISADGRFVVFASSSDNLTPAINNGLINIFLKDRLTGAITNITDVTSGEFGPFAADCFLPAISGDGSTVTFLSKGTFTLGAFGVSGHLAVWVYNVASQTFSCPTGSAVTLPNADCASPSLSQDGRFLVFSTTATNIVSTPPSAPVVDFANPSGGSQVYVVDLQAASGVAPISLLSPAMGASTTGATGFSGSPAISADGTLVAFESSATNLIASPPAAGIYTSTVGASAITLVSLGIDKTSLTVKPGTGLFFAPVLSSDGRFVLFASDSNNWAAGFAIYRFDQSLGQALPVATDLSTRSGFAIFPDLIGMTYDGQTIVYNTGFTAVTVRNLATGAVQIVSVNISGAEANQQCFSPGISGNGQWAIWYTGASNLIASDTNGCDDVFVRGPLD